MKITIKVFFTYSTYFCEGKLFNMKEVWSSILEVSKERIKNPFIGSFAFSWIIFNWKPLMYMLFSSDTMENKITYVQTTYENAWNGLVYPLLFALIYIVFLPYMMWGLEKLFFKAKSGRKQNRMKEDLETIRIKQVTTVENLKLENIKAEFKETQELNERIQKLNLELKTTKELIKSKDDKIVVYQNDINNLKTQLNSLIHKPKLTDNNLYKYFEFKSSPLFNHFIEFGNSKLGSNKDKKLTTTSIDIINKLKDENLIMTKNNEIYFTDKGENFWDIYKNDNNKNLLINKPLNLDD